MQTLRRSATLRAVCFASLPADDIESKCCRALVRHGRIEAIALVRQGLVRTDATFEDGSSPLATNWRTVSTSHWNWSSTGHPSMGLAPTARARCASLRRRIISLSSTCSCEAEPTSLPQASRSTSRMARQPTESH